MQVLFGEDLWSRYSEIGYVETDIPKTRIKTVFEAKELLRQHGYEYFIDLVFTDQDRHTITEGMPYPGYRSCEIMTRAIEKKYMPRFTTLGDQDKRGYGSFRFTVFGFQTVEDAALFKLQVMS